MLVLQRTVCLIKNAQIGKLRRADALLVSLLDMSEGGRAGAAVSVTANGAVTVQGFSGSAVSSLAVRVNDYAALKQLTRSGYSGRVVDILNVKMA